eukprot:3724284-Amphidinium_carterae.4
MISGKGLGWQQQLRRTRFGSCWLQQQHPSCHHLLGSRNSCPTCPTIAKAVCVEGQTESIFIWGNGWSLDVSGQAQDQSLGSSWQCWQIFDV